MGLHYFSMNLSCLQGIQNNSVILPLLIYYIVFSVLICNIYIFSFHFNNCAFVSRFNFFHAVFIFDVISALF